MKKIAVTATKNYDVLIGTGILSNLGAYVASFVKATKAAVISDSNVYPLYGRTVENSLKNAGLEATSYVFPAGEASKTVATYLSILQFLAENKFSRSDLVIALGGGVVGDITGFAAATYLRGISYVQVPTSLLAMVDSSVGGKTAVDLPAGKNLVGAFYQPSLVLCDIDVLNTLTTNYFRDGCAEIIKYGVLYDQNLFNHLAHNGLNFDRETVISRCVELKRNVVLEDEFDTGTRQKLNLGHTIGHSIESLSNYTISHGFAVSMGMAIVAKSAVKSGLCSMEACTQICSVLSKFGLPICVEYSAESLFKASLSDKKRFGGSVNLILPVNIGNCIIQPTPVKQLQSFIEAGL